LLVVIISLGFTYHKRAFSMKKVMLKNSRTLSYA